MYEKFGISKEIIELSEQVEQELKEEFEKVDKIKEENSLKVLMAFQKYKISDMHFGSTTGYGYGDIGRDTIEQIFADVLGAEDSVVRNQFISGTHALTVALFSMLRPGDTMLSINGKPYDTLDEVIGLVENKSSLKSYGVKYEQIDLIGDDFDIPKIVERAKQSIEVEKRVRTFKATLANGQVICDLTIDENGNVTGEKQHVTYMEPSETSIPRNGYLKLELDNELIQGATLDVTYEIKVTNISELDYLSEKYYKYGTIEGEVVKLEVAGLVDYLDKDWAYEAQDQWTEKEIADLQGIVTNEVYSSEEIKDRTILYTESLKGQKLEPTKSASVTLNVAKVLSNQDEINLNNEAEVTEIKKDGGSNVISIPGNYIPGTEIPEHDSDMAPEVIVTPNTGENQNFVLPITVALTAIIVLGAGVIFIKKKVLNK